MLPLASITSNGRHHISVITVAKQVTS